MRNLKRVLSLALALVMVLGMMVITTSAADYTDAEEITYTEAVEVMSTIGILKGNPNADGTFTFDPQGTLTRAQAAKIIAFVCLGAEADEYLTGSTAAFEDVKADSWAAKYVAFCKNAKIIDGVNAEKTLFNPTGTLNTVQFAKMLLGALGIEGTFTGNGWEANVKTAAAEAGLDVIDIDKTDITREEACEMALAAMRDYSATSEVYWTLTVSPTEIYTFETQNDALLYKSLLNATTAPIDGPFVDAADTLLEDVYGVTYNSNTADTYGRPAVSYTGYNNSFKLVYTADPVMTSTTTIKAADLYNKLGYKAVIDASGCSFVHANGVGTGAYWITGGTGAATTDYAVANKNVNIGADGILTEIYKADIRGTVATVEYIMVQTRASLAKVGAPTKVDASATEGAKTTYTLTPDSVGSAITLVDYTSVVDAANDKDNFVSDVELAKDAYVWVYSDANGFYTVKPAESKTVTATWQDATSFIADGVTYKYNVNTNGTIASSDVTGKAAKVVYLDLYGNVAKVANPSGGKPNYAFVLAVDSETVMFQGTTYFAKLLYTDGTVETVKIPTADNGLLNKMVTYAPGTGTDTGKIDLTEVLGRTWDVSGSNVTITKNNPTSSANFFNDKTIFVVETTDATTFQKVYTAYTGISNVPTLTSKTYAASVVNGVTGAVEVYFAMGAELSVAPATAKDVLYLVADSKATATDVDKGTYYTYNAIVNGEIKKIESSNASLANGIYGSATMDAKGLISSVTALSGNGIALVAESSVAVAAKDGVIKLGSTNYIYNDATVVYTVAAGTNAITLSTIDAIETGSVTVNGYTTNGILSMLVIEK